MTIPWKESWPTYINTLQAIPKSPRHVFTLKQNTKRPSNVELQRARHNLHWTDRTLWRRALDRKRTWLTWGLCRGRQSYDYETAYCHGSTLWMDPIPCRHRRRLSECELKTYRLLPKAMSRLTFVKDSEELSMAWNGSSGMVSSINMVSRGPRQIIQSFVFKKVKRTWHVLWHGLLREPLVAIESW